MFFNSFDFAVFLPVVFAIYWSLAQAGKSLRLQNFLIVIASLVFYGWWDWRFLILIACSTVVDFSIGIALSKEDDDLKRKALLWTSLLVNLGFLGFFKYYNFFLDNFIQAFSFAGVHFESTSLKIILPVGISFYTFQTLSYTIDVYKRKLEATQDLIAFSAFVSFFPQLVAGPIERASNLLPQFQRERTFDPVAAVDGLRQILWGLFKKIVIADNCAFYANAIFNSSGDCSGSDLVLGAFFFSFQIYCDFSGYSDIAIGTSRLFGFNLKQNFNFPYFSRDIAEFWRRWHISLSTWFRDYLYIPLGGSRGGVYRKIRNVLIIFIVSGFWHGANWTFIAWGALNALFILPLILSKRNRAHLDTIAARKTLPSIGEAGSILLTFALTTFAWIFFRAENLVHARDYIAGIFSNSLFTLPTYRPYSLLICILILLCVEWFGRQGQYGFDNVVTRFKKPIRYVLYYAIIIATIWLGGSQQEFIYFQF